MVSKAEELKISEEAKRILEKFSAEIGKVEFKGKDIKRKVGGFRREGGEKCGEDPKNRSSLSRKLPKATEVSEFRKMMFENAPVKEGDFIIAEKKKW